MIVTLLHTSIADITFISVKFSRRFEPQKTHNQIFVGVRTPRPSRDRRLNFLTRSGQWPVFLRHGVYMKIESVASKAIQNEHDNYIGESTF